MVEYVDPNVNKELLYSLINNGGNGDLPSNSPYKMIFETILESTNSLELNLRSSLALTNPILATTKEELFTNLSDRDEQYLFSTPAKSIFTLRIPLKQIMDLGIHDEVNDIRSITLPKNSSIEVDNITFTLLYNVTIDITNQSGLVPYVNYDVDDTTIIYGEEGSGDASIIVDASNEEWVIFNVQFAQLSVDQYLSNSIVGTKYDTTFNIKDTYFNSILERKVNGEWVTVPKYYVDNTFDLSIPSAYLRINDNSIRYTIPKNFVDTTLNGSFRTTIYTTKGKIRMKMSNYRQSDFKFIINTNVSTNQEAVSAGLTIIISNTSIIDGGTLPTSFENLKARIINRATSRIDIPITSKQLLEVIRREGMVGELVEDSLYNRIYLAKQETYSIEKDSSFFTTFLNTVKMNEYFDPQDTINISPTFIEYKPFTVFKKDGGFVTPITKTELEYIKSLTRKEIVNTLNGDNNYFISLYTNIVKINEDTIESKVYEEQNPYFDNLSITNRNTSSLIKCSITDREISRDNNDLTFIFRIAGNDAYGEIKDKVKIQITMNTDGGTINNTTEYVVDDDDEYYKVTLTLAPYIKDEKLIVTNGKVSAINRQIDLVTDIKAYIYVLDSNTYNNSTIQSKNYMDTSLIYSDVPIDNLIGLTKEHGEVTLVKELEHLWRPASVNTLSKIYQRHQVDTPLRYTEDVYEIDGRTNSIYFIEDSNNDGICDGLSTNKLHSIGDIVYDDLNDMVYKHKIGDIFLDDDGEPIETNDVNYTVDLNVLMVDYKYLVINNPLFNEYKENLKGLLNVILTQKMVDINSKTMDNTKIYFKPKNTLGDVFTTDGISYDSLIKPTVVIYYDKNVVSVEDEVLLNVSIGNIFRKYLTKKYFNLKSIEDEISKSIGNSIAVDITDFTNDNLRVFSTTTENSFYMNTVLGVDGIMNYDITIMRRYV